MTLAHTLAQTAHGGAERHTTVLPFLLRGVDLLGIDTVYSPTPRRQQAWNRIAQDLPRALLEGMTQEIGLEDVPEIGHRVLAGEVQGRTITQLPS